MCARRVRLIPAAATKEERDYLRFEQKERHEKHFADKAVCDTLKTLLNFQMYVNSEFMSDIKAAIQEKRRDILRKVDSLKPVCNLLQEGTVQHARV